MSSEINVTEYTAAAISGRVNRGASTISGVKIIGLSSKNGRDYPDAVLKNAVHHYEGAMVNVDHPQKTATSPRSVVDRIGVFKNVKHVPGKGLYGDFKYNPTHPVAEQLAWWAENSPEAVGFSHNARLRVGPKRNGRDQVEAITAVRSVDLVADPATTSGVFEHVVDSLDEREVSPEMAGRMILEGVNGHRSEASEARLERIGAQLLDGVK